MLSMLWAPPHYCWTLIKLHCTSGHAKAVSAFGGYLADVAVRYHLAILDDLWDSLKWSPFELRTTEGSTEISPIAIRLQKHQGNKSIITRPERIHQRIGRLSTAGSTLYRSVNKVPLKCRQHV